MDSFIANFVPFITPKNGHRASISFEISSTIHLHISGLEVFPKIDSGFWRVFPAAGSWIVWKVAKLERNQKPLIWTAGYKSRPSSTRDIPYPLFHFDAITWAPFHCICQKIIISKWKFPCSEGKSIPWVEITISLAKSLDVELEWAQCSTINALIMVSFWRFFVIKNVSELSYNRNGKLLLILRDYPRM